MGAGPLTNYWRHEGTVIAITTNQTYTITNVQLSHATNYSVIVSNYPGASMTATSTVAALFVHANFSVRLTLWGNTTTSFWLHASGVTNRDMRVEISSNLVNWSAVATNRTSFWFTNSISTNVPVRFFRLMAIE